MGDGGSGSGSGFKGPTLPPPCPKSPPAYPDLYGRRREMARLQLLERERGFLEEELKFVEGLQPASRCCKEIVDFVTANADPLIPTNRKISKSCQLWKWLCGSSCFNLSWVCCCTGCSIHLKAPECCCCCSLPDCSSCFSCSLPKCSCWCNPCSCCCSTKKQCEIDKCCSCFESLRCSNCCRCCCDCKCSCPKCSDICFCFSCSRKTCCCSCSSDCCICC